MRNKWRCYRRRHGNLTEVIYLVTRLTKSREKKMLLNKKRGRSFLLLLLLLHLLLFLHLSWSWSSGYTKITRSRFCSSLQHSSRERHCQKDTKKHFNNKKRKKKKNLPNIKEPSSLTNCFRWFWWFLFSLIASMPAAYLSWHWGISIAISIHFF